MKWVTRLLVAGLLAAITPASSQAAFTTFTTLAGFTGATSNIGVDNYNLLGGAQNPPPVSITSPLARTTTTGTSYTYTASAANGLFSAGTNADRWLSHNTATDSMVFNNFSAGTHAIGGFFFLSDIAGQLVSVAGSQLNVTAVDSLGATFAGTITNPSPTFFVGFVSTGNIVSLTLTAVQPAGGFFWSTANDLHLAQRAPTQPPTGAVPAPAALVLAALGAPMFGLFRLRRRAA